MHNRVCSLLILGKEHTKLDKGFNNDVKDKLVKLNKCVCFSAIIKAIINPITILIT